LTIEEKDKELVKLENLRQEKLKEKKAEIKKLNERRT